MIVLSEEYKKSLEQNLLNAKNNIVIKPFSDVTNLDVINKILEKIRNTNEYDYTDLIMFSEAKLYCFMSLDELNKLFFELNELTNKIFDFENISRNILADIYQSSLASFKNDTIYFSNIYDRLKPIINNDINDLDKINAVAYVDKFVTIDADKPELNYSLYNILSGYKSSINYYYSMLEKAIKLLRDEILKINPNYRFKTDSSNEYCYQYYIDLSDELKIQINKFEKDIIIKKYKIISVYVFSSILFVYLFIYFCICYYQNYCSSEFIYAASTKKFYRARDMVYSLNVNYCDEKGDTPLIVASQLDSDISLLLINRGADINAKNNIGNTPLLIAAKYYNRYVALKLIEKGAEVNVKDRDGNTPLILFLNNNQQEYEVALKLIEKGADVNAKSNIGDTPLLLATKNDKTDVAMKLIEKGADVNAKSNIGDTPLLLATENDNTNVAMKLIEKGANINTKDSGGRTPLMIALLRNNLKLVNKLVESGSDLKATDNYGKSVYDYAHEYDVNVIELLDYYKNK